MKRKNNPRQKRFIKIGLIFLGFAIAISLLLFAMRNELNHYYSLGDIAQKTVPIEQKGIRVGGMVEEGSIQRMGDTLTVYFKITDFQNPPLSIEYTGILPDLFREKQGVIARGTLKENGVFLAEEILAKHDENYMPPELKKDLEKTPHAR